MGIALAWANTSRKLIDTALELGREVEPREITVELTYRAPINNNLTIQPGIHYVANPGLDPSLKDVIVIGLRVELTLMR
jgi:carbohydrate-selective porin OprB